MRRDHEDVRDALLHGDCNQMALVLLFLDLIQSLHVNAIKALLQTEKSQISQFI